jgi:4-hydroxy-tetrahydrodipicolinate synthase
VLRAGGEGVISVVSNATPRLMAALCDRGAEGAWGEAEALHEQLAPWMRAAFVESNPIPVKAALAMQGRLADVLRLPLVPLLDEHRPAVAAALRTADALEVAV